MTMVWLRWYNLGLKALLAIHPPISPLTSSGQRNRSSWASQPQKLVTFLHMPRREGNEVHKDLWGHCGGEGKIVELIAKERGKAENLIIFASCFI